ncbi:MAG TPA: flagellar biosynthesis protein FlgM, partial [bacterium]|nr:flagellar biosynthesis protein FlgM [bacterium]
NCQREDGFISITMNPEKGRVYEDITQPPLFAYTALELYKTTKNRDFLEFVYNAIKRYIEWLYRNRDNDSDGLLEWLINEGKESKCGESGMDNSPRFDDIEPEDHLA